MDEVGHIVGALGLVRDERGQVLLVQTATTGWELPGGRVGPGEDLIAALEREVMEEAGCRVFVERLCGVYVHLGERPSVLLVFLCRHVAGEPLPGDDSLAACWFNPEEAASVVVHASERLRLQDALAGSGVVYRALRPTSRPARPGDFEEVRSARWLEAHASDRR